MDIQVEKRDGRMEELRPEKITNAIRACLMDGGVAPDEKLVGGVTNLVMNKILGNGNPIHVENIQDKVENSLMEMGLYDDARRYIKYREKKARERSDNSVPPEVRQKIEESLLNFDNELSKFLFYRSYARYREEDKRRETWTEAVDRTLQAYEKVSDKIPKDTLSEIRDYIMSLKVMPSMRVLNFAGPALDRDNILAYNCSFMNIDSLDSFVEELYILMCGCGVGFSVELFSSVDKLPRIRTQAKRQNPETFVVPDTAEGWAEALRIGLNAWFAGRDVIFDYSNIRPAGSRLKTKGGFSSGPGPLKELLDFVRNLVLSKQGQKLAPIDAHDIACMVAQVVVSGGSRRSATISLSDPEDYDMRTAKSGSFWITAPYRALSNNSCVFEEKPSPIDFMDEWLALAKSGTGERGIFNRQAALKCRPRRRKAAKFGTNPCGEIILRNHQTCNLTEVVLRPDDTWETVRDKVRIATIMGVIQSMLTHFPFLSEEWKRNAEEERLLGVSLTGILDCPLFSCLAKDPRNAQAIEKIEELRNYAVRVSEEWADLLGINHSAAVSCVKPSGSVSILVNSSSGIHPRWSKYYIRRVRINSGDPLLALARDHGVPVSPEVGQSAENATTWVLSFPVKAPEGCVTRHDITALEQLELWLTLRKRWAEHSVSCTIYVDESEWLAVGNWVYEHWDAITGLSFLPKDSGIYPLAPYTEITKEEYERLAASLKPIDYCKLPRYERVDTTRIEREWACTGDKCEL